MLYCGIYLKFYFYLKTFTLKSFSKQKHGFHIWIVCIESSLLRNLWINNFILFNRWYQLDGYIYVHTYMQHIFYIFLCESLENLSKLCLFRYYGISDKWVDWTSMIYMILYIPLIFPGSWFLDKMVTLSSFMTDFYHFVFLFIFFRVFE